MEEEQPTFDSYRTAYIAARWDVSDNCAKALQLFEIGFTISGAATHLPVTEGTVSKYHDELQEKINPQVVYAATPSKPRFDVFGENGDTYEQGKAHGEQARKDHKNTPVTSCKEQLDPKFRQRELPLNKGPALHKIDPSLITIRT